MTGAIRTILEVIPATGVNPTLSVDTDELDPPSYADLTVRREYVQSIGPTDSDVAIAIPNACALVVLADEPVILKLEVGETGMRVRHFALGAEDSDSITLTARDLLFSGNGATTATIQVYVLGANP